jgi:hypothetical protein
MWDIMEKLDGEKLLSSLAMLASMNQLMQLQPIDAQSFGYPIENHREANGRVELLIEMTRILEMPASNSAARRIQASLADAKEVSDPPGFVRITGVEFQRLKNFVNVILTTLPDELSSRLMVVITYRDSHLFSGSVPLFGVEVERGFSSVAYDIDEAGKCLALERSTASAFHSIRVLEAAIRSLSRCLHIPDPTKAHERSWFKALIALKAAIDARWPPGSSDRSHGEGRIFEEIHASLAAIQNPWRNATMHLDQKYTQEEAREIFEVVRGLMRRVASRCDEMGEPKA